MSLIPGGAGGWETRSFNGLVASGKATKGNNPFGLGHVTGYYGNWDESTQGNFDAGSAACQVSQRRPEAGSNWASLAAPAGSRQLALSRSALAPAFWGSKSCVKVSKRV